MRIYYSGGGGCEASRPERYLAAKKPCIMLTYYEIIEKVGRTVKRFGDHKKRRRHDKRQ